MIVYISIGNSDDKLSQAEWSTYLTQTDILLHDRQQSNDPDNPVLKRHGAWVSYPDDPWQNACWCVEVEDAPDAIKELQDALRGVAIGYRQDSIAWAVVAETEFLRGIDG